MLSTRLFADECTDAGKQYEIERQKKAQTNEAELSRALKEKTPSESQALIRKRDLEYGNWVRSMDAKVTEACRVDPNRIPSTASLASGEIGKVMWCVKGKPNSDCSPKGEMQKLGEYVCCLERFKPSEQLDVETCKVGDEIRHFFGDGSARATIVREQVTDCVVKYYHEHEAAFVDNECSVSKSQKRIVLTAKDGEAASAWKKNCKLMNSRPLLPQKGSKR